MTGRVAGKVAFITGAARGQGRAHAIALAEEGADIIAVDICENVKSVDYVLATPQDLEETAAAVRALGRKVLTRVVDVRDAEAMKTVVNDGVAEFGHLDIVVANAGVCITRPWNKVSPQIWQDTLDINLTGVWNTCTATIPHLIKAGGGSIIITSSTGGIKGLPFLAPYVATKHAIVGIAKSLANELASNNIRVNTIHPTGVNTPMVTGLGGEAPTASVGSNKLSPIYDNMLDVGLIEARDVSYAVLYLASDEAKYVTGTQLKIDAGNTNR